MLHKLLYFMSVQNRSKIKYMHTFMPTVTFFIAQSFCSISPKPTKVTLSSSSSSTQIECEEEISALLVILFSIHTQRATQKVWMCERVEENGGLMTFSGENTTMMHFLFPFCHVIGCRRRRHRQEKVAALLEREKGKFWVVAFPLKGSNLSSLSLVVSLLGKVLSLLWLFTFVLLSEERQISTTDTQEWNWIRTCKT